MDRKQLIKQIIFYGKILYEQGLNHSHSGNISVRNGDKILIKKQFSLKKLLFSSFRKLWRKDFWKDFTILSPTPL